MKGKAQQHVEYKLGMF